MGEPIPWRLYPLTFVTWVLIAFLGGPDAVAGSGSGPLPHEPVAALHEAAERTLRSTFRVTIVDNDDQPGSPRLVVAVDPGSVVLLMWQDDQLFAFRDHGDTYLHNEGPYSPPWLRSDWPLPTPPQELAYLLYLGFDIEMHQMPLWLLDGVTQAEHTGSRTYSGTLDTRRARPRHPGVARDYFDGGGFTSGDDPTAVPFQATVDPRGRLVRLTLQTDAKGGTRTWQLTGLGEPVHVPSLPASDIEDGTY
ncbi:hypothetical protein DFJ67_7584 [Asanoa ferruginea]|uniref:Uncharacterized protein n=1 Tax=Asanoa ferruginea TaxID=53367 RepID=A0A3D9ZWT5_9ACTN|nr:hypothetical protein [Asanoa ferruginea]REG01500.1 hypothetical protein DFJ67_7584 [Asanoa ferruginea]GIF47873.1 hypothetical protein Afe04nite_24120 [Asanoa ferruginea]